MIQPSFFDDVAKATVTLTQKGGKAVLVTGNLILTAAHCVNYTCDGAMAPMGGHFIEDIETINGNLKASPYAVEPCSDIAVLGALDDQEFSDDFWAFEEFCEQIKPVPICREDYPLFKKFDIYIYTHKGFWVSGKAKQCAKGARVLSVEADAQIEGGTSGSPVINDSGELVGIVSWFSEGPVGEGHACAGGVPRPLLTLPVWICHHFETYESVGA